MWEGQAGIFLTISLILLENKLEGFFQALLFEEMVDTYFKFYHSKKHLTEEEYLE